MRFALERVVAVSMGAWLVLFVGPTPAAAQDMGNSVIAMAGSATPSPAVPGEAATSSLSATASPPSSGPYPIVTGPTWSWSLNGAGTGQLSIDQPDPSSSAATLTGTFTSPGTYNVSATATATWTDSNGGTTSASGSTGLIVFTAVGVQKLQCPQGGLADPVGGGYVDVSGTVYVLVGQSVTFRATPTPIGSGFPVGKPVWSGSSGASGSAETVSVAFATVSGSTSDYQTVTATCGNTSATAYVIVFDLLPVATPQDNFEGRDLDAWGVCEYIDLSYRTTPSGISGPDIGGLQWQITSGGGDLDGGAGGVGTYQCPDEAASVVLSLVVTGGPMLGQKKDAPSIDIVEPKGAKVLRQPDTDLWHVMDTCSVGFCGDYYATSPKAVSFSEILVREGKCDSEAKGWFIVLGRDKLTHQETEFVALKALVKDKGYQWDFSALTPRKYDKVSSGHWDPVYAVGTFKWPIPNEFKPKKRKGILKIKEYAKANHEHESDAAGKCTIQKAGSGQFSKNAAHDTVRPANWND